MSVPDAAIVEGRSQEDMRNTKEKDLFRIFLLVFIFLDFLFYLFIIYSVSAAHTNKELKQRSCKNYASFAFMKLLIIQNHIIIFILIN